VQDQLGKRPIAFARTTATVADHLGLGPYLLGAGLVRVLQDTPVVPSATVKPLPALGLSDVPTTRTLLFHVYHPHSAARHRPFGWLDTPSEVILVGYAFQYQSFAMGAGDPDTAEVRLAAAEADSIFRNTSYRSQMPPAR